MNIMNSSSNEISFTVSTQETPLLQNDPPTPSQPRIKNLKTKIFFTLRIIFVLIAGFLILYIIYSKNRKPEPRNPYLSGLSKFYCHLTRYPKLCRDSMSSITNATALEPNPALIFATSLQLVVIELNHTTVSIAKAQSFLPAPNTSLEVVGPRLSTCRTLVSDSLSRLNKSFGLLEFDVLFYDSLEHSNVTDEVQAVKENIGRCLSALHEIDRELGEGGVEEVKSGVEKASRLLVNFKSLFRRRHVIFHDFYNRFNYFEEEAEGYNFIYSYFYHQNYHLYWYGFDYGLMVCLYSVMYLFVALLYFLFWQ